MVQENKSNLIFTFPLVHGNKLIILKNRIKTKITPCVTISGINVKLWQN